jgi:hypothetical protein
VLCPLRLELWFQFNKFLFEMCIFNNSFSARGFETIHIGEYNEISINNLRILSFSNMTGNHHISLRSDNYLIMQEMIIYESFNKGIFFFAGKGNLYNFSALLWPYNYKGASIAMSQSIFLV